MSAAYRDELSAIHQLRDFYPNMPRRRLARKIAEQTFTMTRNKKLAETATAGGERSFFSVYSALRRYDAKRLAATFA